jgi:hypothetical protein
MSAASESKGPVILFLITWYAVAKHTWFESYSFIVALLLMLIGWLGIKAAGNAIARLRWKAWLLLLQVAAWFVLFLFFAPPAPNIKVLILWGVGIPLLFTGGLARRVYERFPQFREEFDAAPIWVSLVFIIAGSVASWFQGYGFWMGFWGALAFTALASVPLYYGWRLAEPLARGKRDARLGSQEGYRAAGKSDER